MAWSRVCVRACLHLGVLSVHVRIKMRFSVLMSTCVCVSVHMQVCSQVGDMMICGDLRAQP